MLTPAWEDPQQLRQPSQGWHLSPGSILQGRHFPCSHARSAEKQRERLNPGEWKKPHPAQSLEGLGAAWLPAAPGLRAALDFELLVVFFCLFVLEAHLIISACYPIHGSLPISLPLACSCSRTSVGWCKPHRASMWTNPPCLAQAACAPFAVPTAPSQTGHLQSPRHTWPGTG